MIPGEDPRNALRLDPSDGQDSEPRAEARISNALRSRFLVAGILIAFVLVAVGAFYLGRLQPAPSRQEAPSTLGPLTSGSPSPFALPTQAPPLAKVSFPNQTLTYPTAWPAELRYPAQFTLVEAVSGTPPGGAALIWTAKLRFHGSPTEAANLLRTFFADHNWQTTETKLDSGGTLLILERDGKKSTGNVIIDPEPGSPTDTRALATIRL